MGARTIAWTGAAAIGLSTGALLLLDAGAGEYAEGAGTNLVWIAVLLPSAAVGLTLASRRPGNPIGWLLLANVLVADVSGLATSYAGYALAHDSSLPASRFAAIFSTHCWPFLFAPLVAIAFLFPDGRLPSPPWRPVVLGGAATFLVTFATGMLGDQTLDPPFEPVEPYALVTGGGAELVHSLGLVGMIVTLLLSFVALGSRFRGADETVRAQLKWVIYAAAFIPVAIVVGTVEGMLTDEPGPATLIALLLPLVGVPVAVGVAVLRYRLYEIDRLISVTLVYGTLTALLAIAFGAVALFGGLALGGGSALPTAAATLAVALAFRPLRDRVQAVVDRRLNPDAYEGLRRIDRFLEDLREGRAEPEQVGAVLASVVSDQTLALYFWLPDDDAHADADGELVRELPKAPEGRTPVRRGELQLATLVHHPRLQGEGSRLLDAAVVHAGLAIEIARLRVEVRRQLAEVARSRARIVAAGYEERRRLERDLHDGAQQRLVSVGLDLRHLQRGLGRHEEKTRAALDSAVGGLGDAIAELRELARGVRPSALDGGLAPALRELASRTALPIDVEATGERFSPQVEAAAYFVASEGLANAAKHAPGARVVVEAGRSNGRLVLSVSDDGPGGAASSPGSGLAGLRDRIAALGGELELSSEPGQGTRLTAELPCER